MQIMVSRSYPVIDAETLTEYYALDTLLRSDDGSFLLYMTSDRKVGDEERVLFLECRDALVWLNETPDALGAYWHFAETENQRSFTSKAFRR
jgi:hypothetical protein